MEKEKWVIFDLDDVVYNFREQWYQSSLAEGIDIPHWSQWPSYDDLSYFKFNNQEDLRAMFIKHKVLENAEPEPEARAAIELLKASGFKVGALTARSWHPEAHEATIESFNRNGLMFDKLVISGLHNDRKSAHIDKFGGNILGFVDDSPQHVKDFTENNVSNVYLRQRPWNTAIRKEFPSVGNLLEFAREVIQSHKATLSSQGLSTKYESNVKILQKKAFK